MKNHILGEGNSEIVFRVTSGNMYNPKNVHFRCMIENFDKDWIDLFTDREVTYLSIPPGKYVFKVITTNSDGIWQQNPTKYYFEIERKFYQTKIFYGLITIRYKHKYLHIFT